MTEAAPTLRVFVAIELPEDVRGEIAALLARLQKGSQFTGAHPTWVAPENLHLTMVFLGDQPPTHIPLIQSAMRQATQGRPTIPLRFRGVELFPNAKAPKVISLHLWGKVERLAAVRDNLAENLRQNGFPVEQRPYRPHLTLARIKSAKGVTGLAALAKSHSTFQAGEFTAGELVLFKSTLTSKGPIYEALAREPFAAANPGSEE